MRSKPNVLNSTNIGMNIRSIESSQLSHYRTLHRFKHFGEIVTTDDFIKYYSWAKENSVEIYILGNGSNTLFTKPEIKTLVLRNKLDKYIKPLPSFRLEVSSSTQIKDVLKYCYENSLSSFYYLASVPATIGGALAMNAGRGKFYGCTIYDFVESVSFLEEGAVKTLNGDQIERSYRQTIFTGKHSMLILSAIFKFDVESFDSNPIQERQLWAKSHQDNIGPNCGSVFKSANFSILRKVEGLSFGKAKFSEKTTNWILNRSKNSKSILALIFIVKILHFVLRRKEKLELEIVKVD